MKKKNYLGIEVESSVIGWEEAQNLPFPGEGELELIAGLAVQYLYQSLGEKDSDRLLTRWYSTLGKLVTESLKKSFQSFWNFVKSSGS